MASTSRTGRCAGTGLVALSRSRTLRCARCASGANCVARNDAELIPPAIRLEVLERDLWACRVCGHFLGERAGIHHVMFGGDVRGMGGRRVHDPDEMVTICWLPGDPARGLRSCHEVVHSSEKLVWQRLLLDAVRTPGVTARQLRRWEAARASAPHGSPSRLSPSTRCDSRQPVRTSTPSRPQPGASPAQPGGTSRTSSSRTGTACSPGPDASH